jgi:hypothetical protein
MSSAFFLHNHFHLVKTEREKKVENFPLVYFHLLGAENCLSHVVGGGQARKFFMPPHTQPRQLIMSDDVYMTSKWQYMLSKQTR